MVIVPDSPVALTNNFAVTNKAVIQFTWSDGVSDGGSPVVDYRISFDQATDTWVFLQGGITLRQFTTSLPLIVGRTYKFRVEARNSVGYSAISVPISILTAQIPATPVPPTTTLFGDTIVVSWIQPDDGGTSISAYTILVAQSDNSTFTEDKVNCDGRNTTIIANRQCVIPNSVLNQAPYNLIWGAKVYAKIIVSNVIGSSPASEAGNGATIQNGPTYPLGLAENRAWTTSYAIGLVWGDVADNGGSQVIDYRVWFDQGSNNFIVLASGISVKQYVA